LPTSGPEMVTLGRFLVVEDDPQTAQSVARVLERCRPTVMAFTLERALSLLAQPREWTGAVIDLGLPDGSGMTAVEFVRDRSPLLPVLVLTGRHDRISINQAHSLRAEFVCKPATESDLDRFARRAVTFERVSEQRLAELVDGLCQRKSLTPRESEIVAAAMADVPRAALLEQLGISENTLKSQVRRLLRKTGHDSLQLLSAALLRDALHGSGGE
jgi:FixJ family two-component response regulator